MVISLTSIVTLDWFSSLTPTGQSDKGSSPALLNLTIFPHGCGILGQRRTQLLRITIIEKNA